MIAVRRSTGCEYGLYQRVASLAMCFVIASIGISGCGGGDHDRLAREKRCIAQAKKDANVLKNASKALLDLDVKGTLTENNGCDSGVDGVYLSFEVDRSISSRGIIRNLQKEGWRVMKSPSEECVACIVQAKKFVDGRSVRVAVLDRPPISTYEIEVAYI